jgi:preprotein translocase subunit SecD
LIVNRRTVVTLLVAGAATSAFAETRQLPDGLYLVLNEEEPGGIPVRYRHQNREERLSAERLMPFLVESVTTGVDKSFDFPTVTISMRHELSEQLSRVTATHVGRQLAIVVAGQIITAPVINEAISVGVLQLTLGAASKDEVEALASVLRSANDD